VLDGQTRDRAQGDELVSLAESPRITFRQLPQVLIGVALTAKYSLCTLNSFVRQNNSPSLSSQLYFPEMRC